MTDARRSLGSFGEDLAARVLVSRGFVILERGWRTRLGEIDLIVRDARGIRFVEVKTRRTGAFGAPEEAVTAAKLRTIAAVGEQYLAARGWQHLPRQIDVLAIAPDAHGSPAVTHLEDVGEGFG